MEAWGLVSVVLVATAGAIATLITTNSRMKLEQKLKYDQADLEQKLGYDRALRDLRLPHYQRLYHTSRCIPRDWRGHDEPFRSDLAGIREQFHDWYFGENPGGMFLSQGARTVYFDLQNQLKSSAQRGTSDRISADESKLLRYLASELRHQLRQDLGTGEPPQIAWTPTGPTPAPPPTTRQDETASPRPQSQDMTQTE